MEMWPVQLMSKLKQQFLFMISVSLSIMALAGLTTPVSQISGYFLQNMDLNDNICATAPSKQFHDLNSQNQQQRKASINDVCHHWKPQTNLTIGMLDHILVDDFHKILYCAIPKVACTTWKKVFVQFSPYALSPSTWNVHNKRFMEAMDLRYLNVFSKTDIIYKIKHYFKVMFVRHPLERLLSAYKDKFTIYNKYTKHFHRKYARKIIKKYRTHGNMSTNRGPMQFSEFVKYIIDLEGSGESFNPHWAQYHELCQPCRINYDFIGKMESMQLDAEFLLQRLAVNSTCLHLPSYMKQSPKTTSIMTHYYGNISDSDLHKLAKVYSLDFQLFGYDSSFL